MPMIASSNPSHNNASGLISAISSRVIYSSDFSAA
jgi:hypothetical protein